MKKLRGTISLMLIATMIFSLTGCKSEETKGMVANIDAGVPIEINVAGKSTPSGEQTALRSDRLDQLKTYNTGFRQSFDEIFFINTARIQTENGIEGTKQGCLFVRNVDGQDIQYGDTCLADSFRNKQFVEKYWKTSSVQTKLIELCSQVYTDVDENSGYALSATLNAYYDLLRDKKEPLSYNGGENLTRDEFYTMLFKATHDSCDEPSPEIQEQIDEFSVITGSKDEYTKYVAQMAEYGFLTPDNGSLTSDNLNRYITRAEAAYMIVQQSFPEQYLNATDSDTTFSDVTSAGDLALKVGFKQEIKDEANKTSEIVEKDMWQAYILAYMLQHPDKGMQSELYRALVVAKQNGFIGNTTKWSSPITKHEAIVMVVNAQLALNNIEGYLTTAEYGEIVDIPVEETLVEVGEDGEDIEVTEGTEGSDVTDGVDNTGETEGDSTESTDETETSGEISWDNFGDIDVDS